VTTSVQDPRKDFEVNALGTFNVLEAVRKFAPEAALLYASTNKVYGDWRTWASARSTADTSFAVFRGSARTSRSTSILLTDALRAQPTSTSGLRAESTSCGRSPFDSPASTVTASSGSKTRVGGLVHHRHSSRQAITIFGDGKQVRDVLFIDDLCELYEAAVQRIEQVSGHVFNIGGGPSHQLSLLELLSRLRIFRKEGPSPLRGLAPW